VIGEVLVFAGGVSDVLAAAVPTATPARVQA
jgi:hypothetical protein